MAILDHRGIQVEDENDKKKRHPKAMVLLTAGLQEMLPHRVADK